MPDAVVVDERVARDARADAEREHERHRVRRDSPHAAHEQDAAGHREHADRGGARSRRAPRNSTEIASTSTGATPRAIG